MFDQIESETDAIQTSIVSDRAQSLNQLRELVEDTQTVAGSEAYAAARLAYSSAKAAGKSMGLDEVMDDLSQRFRKPRKATSSGE